MPIGPLEMNAVVTRTQDFSTIKHNEDNKGFVDQTNIQNQFTKELDNKAHQVTDSQESQMSNRKYDAKEKGDNSYYGDGGKNRKKKKETDGKVISKGKSTGFDMKI